MYFWAGILRAATLLGHSRPLSKRSPKRLARGWTTQRRMKVKKQKPQYKHPTNKAEANRK
jgi:hypothetical protein